MGHQPSSMFVGREIKQKLRLIFFWTPCICLLLSCECKFSFQKTFHALILESFNFTDTPCPPPSTFVFFQIPHLIGLRTIWFLGIYYLKLQLFCSAIV